MTHPSNQESTKKWRLKNPERWQEIKKKVQDSPQHKQYMRNYMQRRNVKRKQANSIDIGPI